VVQDFVSVRACCVNQYHYESLSQQVVMRFVDKTGKTWYKVLYKHTMYVISFSNISIKTNFKQIIRVEIRLTNLYNNQKSEGDYILCMASRFLPFILCLHCSHWRVLPCIPMIWRYDKINRQGGSRATLHHCFITTVWWYNILYQKPCIILDNDH